jgi:hypothetical protein
LSTSMDLRKGALSSLTSLNTTGGTLQAGTNLAEEHGPALSIQPFCAEFRLDPKRASWKGIQELLQIACKDIPDAAEEWLRAALDSQPELGLSKDQKDAAVGGLVVAITELGMNAVLHANLGMSSDKKEELYARAREDLPGVEKEVAEIIEKAPEILQRTVELSVFLEGTQLAIHYAPTGGIPNWKEIEAKLAREPDDNELGKPLGRGLRMVKDSFPVVKEDPVTKAIIFTRDLSFIE